MRAWGVGLGGLVGLWALALAGCADMAAPPLSPLVEVGPTVGTAASVRAASRTLSALYVTPRSLEGIAPESGGLSLIDAVVVLDDQGDLRVADLIHDDAPAAFRQGKLELQDVLLASPHGAFTGPQRRFDPVRDVLATLDTGYQVDVRVGALSRRMVFRPLYDANLYRPFSVEGRDGTPGPVGGTGRGGAQGGDGDDGADGADGFTGNPGQDGKDGEEGSNAGHAGPGRGGRPGMAADPGPDLRIRVLPIYSKFYPDEELVFVRVQASFRHRGSRSPYEQTEQNYIFHPNQAFTITSLGGAGGSGGAGGRGGTGGRGGEGGDGGDGGDGGNGVDNSGGRGGDGANGGAGGDGGDGGDGGNAGRGGPGASGGAGGDGGAIRVDLAGPPGFQRTVRSSLQLRSVAGSGGLAGAGGFGGPPGPRGKGGDGGEGGKAGRGGRGQPSGSPGKDGAEGKDGSSGDSGNGAKNGKPGLPGRPGRAGPITWR